MNDTRDERSLPQRIAPPSEAVPVLAEAALDVGQVVAFVNKVRAIAKESMQEGIHYGRIPGVQKKSLWQPGAEVLCVAFHLAPTFDVVRVDEPNGDRTYEATCRLVHQGTGLLIASASAECSTGEEKYAWRKAVDHDEFERTFEDRRRVHRKKKWNDQARKYEYFDVEQVRTKAADLGNTCRRMACKRAHVGATRSATSASDTFSEGLEELAELGVDLENGEDKRPPVTPPKTKQAPPPAQTSETASLEDATRATALVADLPDGWVEQTKSKYWHSKGGLNAEQRGKLFDVATEKGWTPEDVALVVQVYFERDLHSEGPDGYPFMTPFDNLLSLFGTFGPGKAE